MICRIASKLARGLFVRPVVAKWHGKASASLIVTCLLGSSVAASPADEALPPQAIIDSCLSVTALGNVRRLPISNGKIYIDMDEVAGTLTSTYRYRGVSLGLTQKTNRPDDDAVRNDALVYADRSYPLRSARKLVLDPKDRLPRLDFHLSDWLLLEASSRRYLCASSNFDGIGRSGSFQNVHFGYLLSLTGPKRLYWFWGDIRQHWRPR